MNEKNILNLNKHGCSTLVYDLFRAGAGKKDYDISLCRSIWIFNMSHTKVSNILQF